MKYSLLFLFHIVFATISPAQEIKTFKEFYHSGVIKQIFHEGTFNGCNMKVGTDSTYFENGRLKATVQYDNRAGKTDPGCHATWTIALTTYFYGGGQIKSRSQQKYSYEGNPCDCGEWITYDVKGTIIKKKSRVDCYDQQPCSNQ